MAVCARLLVRLDLPLGAMHALAAKIEGERSLATAGADLHLQRQIGEALQDGWFVV